MKIDNISTNYNIKQYNLLQKPTFKAAIPRQVIEDSFERISNPANRAFYEKLVTDFKDQTPRITCLNGCVPTKQAIIDAYNACLDSNGEVNKYAASTLYKMCYKKFEISKASIMNFIHDKILDNLSKKDNYYSWEEDFPIRSKILDKTELCSDFRDYGVGTIARFIEACKDKNGNHHKENLDFANYIEKNCTIINHDIPKFINFCKDPETGICTQRRIEIFKNYYKSSYFYMLLDLPNQKGEVTDTALEFLRKSRLAMIKLNKDDKYIYRKIMDDALKYADEKDRDEILKYVYEHRAALIQETDKYGDSTPLRVISDISKVHDNENDTYHIPLVNLKYLVELIEDRMSVGASKGTTSAFYFWRLEACKDYHGIIKEENLKTFERLATVIRTPYDDNFRYLEEFSEFRNKDGIINSDFCERLIAACQNLNGMPNSDYGNHFHTFTECMEVMKNKDNTVNFDVVEAVYPLYYAIWNENESLKKQVLVELSMLARNENGDFCKEGIEKIKKLIPKKQEELFSIKTEKLLSDIKVAKKLSAQKTSLNLYEPKEVLKFMNDLKINGKIPAEAFSTPINEEGTTLLMHIADMILPEGNKDAYFDILQMLKSTRGINFNQKDKFGVSFLEKVLFSENFELFDIIKNKRLKYDPSLEYTYQGIQNPEFKEKIKELNLSFPDLEEAVEIGSWDIFDKLKSQLGSPLCNTEKEVEYLSKLADKNKNYAVYGYLKDYWVR